MEIRALEHDDLPSVARQYEKLLRSGEKSASPGLVAAFRRMFLDTPTYQEDIPSLVIETNNGIGGFQGVQVREFEFNGTRRRLASLGPLFVIPN